MCLLLTLIVVNSGKGECPAVYAQGAVFNTTDIELLEHENLKVLDERDISELLDEETLIYAPRSHPANWPNGTVECGAKIIIGNKLEANLYVAPEIF